MTADDFDKQNHNNVHLTHCLSYIRSGTSDLSCFQAGAGGIINDSETTCDGTGGGASLSEHFNPRRRRLVPARDDVEEATECVAKMLERSTENLDLVSLSVASVSEWLYFTTRLAMAVNCSDHCFKSTESPVKL